MVTLPNHTLRLTPERRRELTRTALLESAAAVFAERGFHGATLDEIAAAAGFSKGAIYSNFANKEELFLALVEERLRTFAEATMQLLADPNGTLESRIASVADLHARYTRDRQWALLYMEFYLYGMRHPEVGRRIIQHEQVAFETYVKLIESELGRLGIQSPIPVDELAAMVTAISEGLWLKQSLDPAAVSPQLFRSSLEFLARAVAALDAPLTG